MASTGHVIELVVAPRDLVRLARAAGASALLLAALEGALDEMAQALQGAIQSHMTFRGGYATGQLESSVQTLRPAPLERKIGSAVEHAAFVEFGTGQRGAASGVTPFGGYAYGSRAGMTAQPYLQPALEDEMDHLRQLAEGAIAQTLAGLAP